MISEIQETRNILTGSRSSPLSCPVLLGWQASTSAASQPPQPPKPKCLLPIAPCPGRWITTTTTIIASTSSINTTLRAIAAKLPKMHPVLSTQLLFQTLRYPRYGIVLQPTRSRPALTSYRNSTICSTNGARMGTDWWLSFKAGRERPSHH